MPTQTLPTPTHHRGDRDHPARPRRPAAPRRRRPRRRLGRDRRPLHPRAARPCRRYRLQDADAHDVIQVTWLRLAQHLDRIHTPEHLAGWLAAVANRECLRVLRRHGAHRRGPRPRAGGRRPGPRAGGRRREGTRRAAGRRHRRLATLPPRRRELLAALFADDGRSYARIAQDVGIPVGSIGPTRARALAHLRRLVERRAVRCTDPGFRRGGVVGNGRPRTTDRTRMVDPGERRSADRRRGRDRRPAGGPRPARLRG